VAPFRRTSWDHEISRILYIGIVIASAVAMAILFVLILNDRHSLTREANIRATQIQQQRYDNVFGNCIDQNRRHDKTIKRLQTLAAKYIKSHPGSEAAIRSSYKQEVFLISGIVPRQNCKAVAKKAVHPLANPNGR
jgi:hypothetical protein